MLHRVGFNWTLGAASLLTCAALLSAAADAQSERFRTRPELLYAAWDESVSDYLTVKTALESFGKVENLYQLNGPGDGRPVSVFRVAYGEEGARVRALRKLPALGALGFSVEQPDDCQLDLTERDDAVALASQAADAAQQEAVAARKHFNELSAIAEASLAEEQELESLLNAALAEEEAKEAARVAAHEAAHVVQQRAGVALRTFQQQPTRANFLALFQVSLELQPARQAEAAAIGALEAARAKSEKTRLEFGQVRARRLHELAQAEAAGGAADSADTKAADAWHAAGSAVNASIVEAADAVAEQAASVAITLQQGAEAAGVPMRLYPDGLSQEAVARLQEISWAMSDAAALAERDAQAALAVAVAARALPPIPRLNNPSEAEQLPQFAVIDQIARAGLTLAVNGAVIATGVLGGSTLNNALFDTLAIVEEECREGRCLDGNGSPLYNGDTNSGQNPFYDPADSYQSQATQNTMNLAGQQFQTISNVLKTKHDTAKNSVSNIR